MTLGRVYVPPNRTSNQFITTNIPTNRAYSKNIGGNSYNNNHSHSHSNANNNNNLVVNGFSEPLSTRRQSHTNGYHRVEITVKKKGDLSTGKCVKEKKVLVTKPSAGTHSERESSDDGCEEWEPESGGSKEASPIPVPKLKADEVVDSGPDKATTVTNLPAQVERSSSTPRWRRSEEKEASDPTIQTTIPTRWREAEAEAAAAALQNGKKVYDEDAEVTSQSSRGSNPEIIYGNQTATLESCPSMSNLPTSAKGLKNLGNTCFMNSIIQCLSSTRILLRFCQSYEATEKSNPFIGVLASTVREPKITRSFVRLVLDMWKSSGVADPTSFRREMTVFAPKFGGYDQHDSQEFLQYVLEGLHNEMNRSEQPPKKKQPESRSIKEAEKNGNCDVTNQNDPTNENKVSEDTANGNLMKTYDPDDAEEPGISAEERGRRSWKQYLKRDNSFITDLFLGQFRSTLKCSECGHESVTFEPFWVVSVPINAKTSKDIMDCLELFVSEETLDGDEQPTCESCKAKRKCTKWYSFERWPKILVLHLKRFAPAGSYRGKLSSLITTPLKSLDLSSFSSCKLKQIGCNGSSNGYSQSQSSILYDCYGISNHSGGLSGGHYTAYCRHPSKNNNWHLYNDRCVSGANPDHVVSSEAYLLFFERVGNYDDNDNKGGSYIC